MIEKERHLFLDVRRVDRVVVVEHEHRFGQVAQLVEQPGSASPARSTPGASSIGSELVPTPGSIVRSASTR